MRTFKVGDSVRVAPTSKRGWNYAGRMEASIGMVGKIVCGSGIYEVRFESTTCDTEGCRDFWTYFPEDLVKHAKFKGNKQ